MQIYSTFCQKIYANKLKMGESPFPFVKVQLLKYPTRERELHNF